MCKFKKHQATNQEAPSENDVDEEVNHMIVNRGANTEAFETHDREFEQSFIKPSHA